MTVRNDDVSATTAMQMVSAISPGSLKSRRFKIQWLVVVLIIVGGILAISLVKSPIYVFGTGVVLADPDGGNARLVAFMPAANDRQVDVGQEVTINFGSEVVESAVNEAYPEVVSPEEAREQFQLSDTVGSVVTEPSRVIVVEFDGGPDGETAEEYQGSLLPITATAGERRMLPAMVRAFFAGR